MSSYIHDEIPVPEEFNKWHQENIYHYNFQMAGSKIGMCSHCGRYQESNSLKCIECGSKLIPKRVTKAFNARSYFQETACRRIHKINGRVLYSFYIASTSITPDHHEETSVFEAERAFVGFPIRGNNIKTCLLLMCSRYSANQEWCDDATYSDYYFGSGQKTKRNVFTMVPDDYPKFFSDTDAKYTCLGEYMKAEFVEAKPDPSAFIGDYWAALNWEWVELLWKAGFKKLYKGMINGGVDRRTITKNTVKGMRKELKELGDPTGDEVMILRKVKQNKLKFTVSEIKGLTLYAVDRLSEAMKLTEESQGKCMRYLSEVCHREHGESCGRGYVENYESTESVQRDWIDYLNMLVELEGTATGKKAFPEDPVKAHDDILMIKNAMKNELRAREQMKKAEDSGLAEMMAQTLIDFNIERMEYTDKNGLMIVAMKSIKDIVEEGALMDHCVGGLQYIENMAKGESFIFSLRNVDAPDIPVGTIEYKFGRGIIQCRGQGDGQKLLPEGYEATLDHWQKHIKEVSRAEATS